MMRILKNTVIIESDTNLLVISAVSSILFGVVAREVVHQCCVVSSVDIRRFLCIWKMKSSRAGQIGQTTRSKLDGQPYYASKAGQNSEDSAKISVEETTQSSTSSRYASEKSARRRNTKLKTCNN